jgi:hypothetical protein
VYSLFPQIPEDLQSILSDQTLFRENAEVTTKEILKRYGDIARGSFSQKPENGGETFTITTPNRNNSAPASARIETDPSQDAAWQMQSSVRHVPGPSGHTHTASANPQAGLDFGPPPAAYHRDRSTSNGSQPNASVPDGQSQNVAYRPRPSPGAMGVTG